MSPLRVVAAMAALSVLPAVAAGPEGPARAQDPREQAGEAAHEWAELFGRAPLPAVWQSAAAASDRISAALAEKKLHGVAGWAETVHLAAHALEDQLQTDDAEKAKRVRGSLRQTAKIADDLLEAARHDEVDQASDAHRRLKAALGLVRARLPKEIVDAPPQELRFARGDAPVHDDKGPPSAKKSPAGR